MRRGLACALALLLLAGCFPRRTPSSRQRGSETAAPRSSEKRAPITSSPSDLFQPDGPRLIQQALAAKAYLPDSHATGRLDRTTIEALKRFQKDSALPRTGFPDRETVRRLGLDPDDVFRTSTSGAGFTGAADLTGAE